MTVRLKSGRQVVVGGIEELNETRRELGQMMADELRKGAPKDTGELRKSIKPGRGKRLVSFSAEHGVIIDAKGTHKGWIERLEKRAIDKWERRR